MVNLSKLGVACGVVTLLAAGSADAAELQLLFPAAEEDDAAVNTVLAVGILWEPTPPEEIVSLRSAVGEVVKLGDWKPLASRDGGWRHYATQPLSLAANQQYTVYATLPECEKRDAGADAAVDTGECDAGERVIGQFRTGSDRDETPPTADIEVPAVNEDGCIRHVDVNAEDDFSPPEFIGYELKDESYTRVVHARDGYLHLGPSSPLVTRDAEPNGVTIVPIDLNGNRGKSVRVAVPICGQEGGSDITRLEPAQDSGCSITSRNAGNHRDVWFGVLTSLLALVAVRRKRCA